MKFVDVTVETAMESFMFGGWRIREVMDQFYFVDMTVEISVYLPH